MIFSSLEFIFIFLPITFFIYFYLNHKRLAEASKGFLVFSSFYITNFYRAAPKIIFV
jgi:alginate O-acetyltransferase complex protein AlgI